MHYFHKLSLALGGFAPRPPPGLYPWPPPLGDFRSQTPNLPTPGKNPAGAYDGELNLIFEWKNVDDPIQRSFAPTGKSGGQLIRGCVLPRSAWLSVTLPSISGV